MELSKLNYRKMELVLGAAAVLAAISFKQNIDAATQKMAGKVGEWNNFNAFGKDALAYAELADPRNPDYLPTRQPQAVSVVPLTNQDAQVFTENWQWILGNPEFKTAYYSNYVEAVDRDHPLLTMVRLQYPYGVKEQRINFMGNEVDMKSCGIH